MPSQNLLAPSTGTMRLNPALTWFAEPMQWTFDPTQERLLIQPDAPTDFWQRTHYGFQADNGHFLFTTIPSDFTLSVRVTSWPQHQYDQAGLMIRISPECWLKTSVEFEPSGPNRLGVVVTNHGYSDWSTQDLPRTRETIHLRVRRTGADYLVESSLDAHDWSQLRLAPLLTDRPDGPVECGLYACSPKAAGYKAAFSELILTHAEKETR
jgi:uncharacterized protein